MSSKIKPPEFKKVSLTKLSKFYSKGSNAKKHFYSVVVLIFSLSVLSASFFAFKTPNTQTPEVQGLSNIAFENYIPTTAQRLESSEIDQGKNTYSYRTSLSDNQIIVFYETLSNLNGWKKISVNTYMCGDKEFSYKITKESNTSNIVTFSTCE